MTKPPKTITAKARLYSRKTTAHVLGDISIDQVIRMEKAGALTVIRLPMPGVNPTKAKGFHAAEQVEALAAKLIAAAKAGMQS